MKEAENRQLNNSVRRFRLSAAVLAAVCVLVLGAIPAAAWFFYQRGVAAVAEVDSPNALYISAGNREDVTYLDLSGIDVENGTPDGETRYQDFVFSVRGEYIDAYRLELAYTSNNQFSYTIYKAAETASEPYNVAYLTHDSTPVMKYYAMEDATPVSGRFLNKQGGAILADNTLHASTYSSEADSAQSYDNVNRYAEPLYWQADGHISVRHRDPDRIGFCDYYIIRVSWPADKLNDRETDIIYISAYVATVSGDSNG
jgi:hypothetical protein